MKARNQILDATKGIAIIFVVLGHAIQQVSGLENKEALNMPILRFIISFHMPLFVFISGYLFYNTLTRYRENDIIKRRIRIFICPILTMAFIHLSRYHILHFEWNVFLSAMPFAIFNSLWFLWALLIITALMCVVHKYMKDSFGGYASVIIGTLFLPDCYPLRAYLFLFPCFASAYLLSKQMKNKRAMALCKNIFGGVKYS